jgi:hypothetical protein
MTQLEIRSGGAPRRVDLAAYLDPAAAERAHAEEHAWIKAVRAMRVDGMPFRSRFTCRGDSLWWFAELYLHKEQAILNVFRTLAAFDALVEQERPRSVAYADGSGSQIVARAAEARGIRYTGPSWPSSLTGPALAGVDARARGLAAGARLSRLRGRGTAVPSGHARIVAFVHRAFWRGEGTGGSAESYIGPVLRAIEARVAPGDLRYVGVGPSTNFRARHWWDPIIGRNAETDDVVPIERYAPQSVLRDARRVYRERHQARRSLWASGDLRAHAVIRGCDCWPLVQRQLAGIALLQFPWSARAMDEAAAALDASNPDIAVTYAEAGGWGRALALECRRRGIPLAGLQHGFIYRHWLNYRHEPDEIAPDAVNVDDRGFPLPARTLVFDDQAAAHLAGEARFPPSSIVVTGSPRLDELIAAIRAIDSDRIGRTLASAGAVDGRALILFAAKEREARRHLPDLLAEISEMDGVQLVIKPHPAETANVYAAAVAGTRHVTIVDPAASLPELLAAARGIVTVNSTVAIDAMALGVPSLVIGLPNNLTPFVDHGLMLGGRTRGEIRAALDRLLYDQEFRSRLVRGAEGRAASRSADAILALARDRDFGDRAQCVC